MSNDRGTAGLRTAAERAAVLAGATAVAVTLTTVVPSAPVAHAYVTRTTAYDMAATGLHERYLFGSSKWINNDVWDATEGADCSGYVGKVYGDPYTSIGTNHFYPDTYSWYTGGAPGAAYSLGWGVNTSRKMDAYVYHTSYGGESNHMGLFQGTQDSNGQWKIWHAASEDWGITTGTKSQQFFHDNSAKRFTRDNW